MEIFKPVIGLYAWGTWWDNQAGTNIEFGEPSLIAHKERLHKGHRTRWVQVKGECSLQLWLTSWTIMEDDDVAATIESPYEGSFNSITAALNRLEGKKLESIDIDSATTTFSFDLGGKLICKRFDEWEADDNMWYLRTPNEIHVCSADGSIRTTREENLNE
jgi:hypothetical protein